MALSISDPKLRQAIAEAVAQTDETLVLVRHIHGLLEWWLVTNEDELEKALARVTTTRGRSDAVEIDATGGFRFQSGDKAWLREQARTPGAVVLACRRQGDPQLHDVELVGSLDDVDEWLADDHEGELVIAPHPPWRRDDEFYPRVSNAFLAYAPLPDGTVNPGPY